MSNWHQKKIEDIAYFDPSCLLSKGSTAKKIPMASLQTFNRKIIGYEISQYNSGPKFMNGDTLVAKITPCLENGKTAYVDILEDKEVAFGSSEFIVLRPKKGNDELFLYYLSISPSFRKRAISCMEGTSGRKRVNENSLKIQELPIPDLSTQQRIAAVLSSLDAKIELNNRINAELESMAKTLYDYWFVQFDFPWDFTNNRAVTAGTPGGAGVKPYKSGGGKMVWNAELKREIPAGWEVKKVEDYCRIFTGKKDVNQAFEYGKYKFFSCAPGYKYSDDKLYEGKAILISGNGSYTGRTIFIDEAFDLYQRTYACVNKTNIDILPYIYYSMLRYLCVKVAGGTHGSAIPYIVFDDIAKEDIPINLKVLNQYQEIAYPILYEAMQLSKQNIQLVSLRDWLLPMLMNGQVKVQ